MDANLSSVQEGDHCRLKISGELTIYCAAELKGDFLGHLKRSQHLEVNLAEVEEIDCAGFQLLYLLKREAKQDNKKLTLVSHSQATLEMLELLNMEAFFGDPVVLAS